MEIPRYVMPSMEPEQNTTANCIYPSMNYDNYVPKHVILCVLSVMLVVGNGILIWTILRHKRLRTVTNLFVVALAFADFSMGFPSIPFHVLGERQAMGQSSLVCLLSMCLTSTQIVVSVILLFALSVERYLKFVHPFKHRTCLTRKRAVIVIVLCWIYALVFGFIPALGWNSLTYAASVNQTLSVCRFEFILPGGYIALLFLGHIVPASLVLPMLHIRVFLTAQQVLRRHADMSDHIPRKASAVSVTSTNPEQQSLASQTRRNLRPFKILVMMVLYFIVSWLPLTVWQTVVFKGFTITNPDPEELFASSSERNGYYIACGLAVMNSVINPLFYGVGNRGIWNAFVQGVKVKCGCGKDGESDVRYSYASGSHNGGMVMKVMSTSRQKIHTSSLQDCSL